MKTIKVVCGIIEKDGLIFIARRKEGKSLAGFWEFPGGKVEETETEPEALERELFEELGMKVEVHELVGQNRHDYAEIKINLIAYRCAFKEANYVLWDHDQYLWERKENLLTYNMAPADVPIIEYILKDR